MAHRMTEQLKDLYHYSPIVWAVVKGADTPALIAERLNKDYANVQRGIRGAINAKAIKAVNGKYQPAQVAHIKLWTQLGGRSTPMAKTPLTEILDNGPMTTSEIAEATGRHYNSVYKTLRRLYANGQVKRVGKLWEITV